jgi:hypothetical protein
MYSPRSRFNRSSQPTSSKQHENIDKQIQVLHQAMALKLIAQPHLRQHVIDTIETRYKTGLLRHGGYLVWICLMECIEESPDAFVQGVIADTPQMRKLRRKTPFVNVLTEQERQEALHNTTITYR